MENQLTSLMKEKYGVTRSSSVTITEKDTLYTAFRKLADSIYKNGEWTEKDEQRAVDTMIRNRNNFPLGEERIQWTTSKGVEWQAEVSIQPLRAVDQMILEERAEGKIGYTTIVNRTNVAEQKTTTQKTYVLLDPKNKLGTKHATFYYFAHKEVDEFTYMALGNRNRAIGYDKLQRDILKEFDQQATPLPFEREDLERLLRKLSDAQYSGKKHANTFQKEIIGELTDEFLATLPRDERMEFLGQPHLAKEMVETGQVDEKNQAWVNEQLATHWGDLSTNPESTMKVNLDKAPYIFQDGKYKRYIDPRYLESYRKKNRVLAFVQSYIENTYNLILQTEYEKDIEKQTRASAWQTKKNINKETREIMEKTSLKNYFGFVELDNDVDLTLFTQFEQEMSRIHAVLPKTGNVVPDLRLRKLGNHKALGMYVPGNHTIAIDFRDTSDAIGGVGIQSFVHEYGHALDYGHGNGQLLSMGKEFKEIVTHYRDNLSLYATTTYVGKKAGYYGAPTEVFARAFELYLSEAGFTSAFIKSTETYQTKIEYTLFDSEMRAQVTTYFDQRFPLIKEQIQSLQDKEAQVTVSPLKEAAVTKQRQSKSKEGGKTMARTHKEREEAWQKANSKSILDVAASLGMGLERSGSSYTWAEHDSFVLTPKRNSFYWNSRMTGGGPIQMVQAVKECSVAQAVDYLQELDVKAFDASKEPPKTPFHYYMKETTDFSLTEDYLMNERQLSEETIHYFISEGLLAQSTYKDKKTGEVEPVIVFKHKDPSGKIQGVALQGIIEDYNKHDRGRLKRTFGDGYIGLSVKVGNPPSFRQATEDNPLKIIAFEAPIDLMSYFELHKDTLGDAVLVTMNGLKKEAVSTYLANEVAPDLPRDIKAHYLEELGKHFQSSKKVQIVLAVDNDPIDEKKGHRPAQHFIEQFPSSVFSVEEAVPEAPKGQEKWDWNEQLKWEKTKKIIDLLEGEKNMSDKQSDQKEQELPLVERTHSEEQSVEISESVEQQSMEDSYSDLVQKVFSEGTDVVTTFQEEATAMVDDALQTNQTYVTKEEVDTILATHFEKITQVLAHYTETVSSEQPLTETKAEEVSKGLIDTLKAILDDCRTQLRNYFQGKKQGVTHSLDTVRVTIKNSINGRVLAVNEQLKKFAAIMDKKFALEEKPSKKKAEESEKANKVSQQASSKETKKETASSKKTSESLRPASLEEQLVEKENLYQEIIKKRDDLIQSPNFLREETRSGDKQLTPAQQVVQYTKELQQVEKELKELKDAQEKARQKAATAKKEDTKKDTKNTSELSPKKEEKKGTATEQEEKKTEKQPSHSKEKTKEKNGTVLFRALLKANNSQAVRDVLAKETHQLLEKETLKKHLEMVAKFPHYSQKNIQLLTKQAPEATEVASANQWKELGYELKDQATPIYVQAPFHTIEKDKNGEPVLDKNGEVVTKVDHHFVPVFDESQVVGREKQRDSLDLEDPKQFFSVYQSLKECCPVPITFTFETGLNNGYYDQTKNQLLVHEGLGGELTCLTIVEELSKILVNQTRPETMIAEEQVKHQFEAEGLAFALSSYVGLDTSDGYFPFIELKQYQTNENGLKELTESLAFITKQAQGLIEKIDTQLEKSKQAYVPKNKFEERLAAAHTSVEAPQQTPQKQEQVDAPKASSPSLNR
ncbi:LPD1 domain-containing protein [Enterococcus faecalis]